MAVPYALKHFAKDGVWVGNLNVNVTNLCTQHCPHCNALPEGAVGQGRFLSFNELRDAVRNLPSMPMSMSFSGGEPTLAPELPDMLEWASSVCPFGINLNTNLYGESERFRRSVETALKVNARIDVSFDGFGEVADRLRGAYDVAKRVEENLKWLAKRRQELGSRSIVTVHTVLNDLNLSQVPQIFLLSLTLGFKQTVAPVNRFFYHTGCDDSSFSLTFSSQLTAVLKMAEGLPNIGQSRRFLWGILAYTRGQAPKLCPYLHPLLKTYKVFLGPGGEVTLCDRTESLGNLLEEPFLEMLKGEAYKKVIERFQKCEGCWLICFVEPVLAVSPWAGRFGL
jgi:MoaA/NifB/PqqE/SkfB family radical SAM enzyme